MALTKRQKNIQAAVVPGKNYPIDEALKIIKDNSKAKFVEAVDVAVRLGVDAKKSDQQVRGSTVLPAGTGKAVRVAVFTPAGAKADEALAAGADAVGMDDLAEKMQGGDLSYDVVIATPDAMRVVGKLGTLLGPRGLMPNPKVGTVSANPGEAVKNAEEHTSELQSLMRISYAVFGLKKKKNGYIRRAGRMVSCKQMSNSTPVTQCIRIRRHIASRSQALKHVRHNNTDSYTGQIRLMSYRAQSRPSVIRY